jgi:hypothetical protein
LACAIDHGRQPQPMHCTDNNPTRLAITCSDKSSSHAQLAISKISLSLQATIIPRRSSRAVQSGDSDSETTCMYIAKSRVTITQQAYLTDNALAIVYPPCILSILAHRLYIFQQMCIALSKIFLAHISFEYALALEKLLSTSTRCAAVKCIHVPPQDLFILSFYFNQV